MAHAKGEPPARVRHGDHRAWLAVWDRRFVARWIGWVTLGESIGFLAPAGVQLLAGSSWPDVLPALLVLAGFAEGAVLGWFQARVLRGRIPQISIRRWTLLTAGAASVAWVLGLLPSATDAWQSWPPAGQAVGGLALGIMLLGSLGLAQWLELRRHLPSAWRWVGGSAAAWCAGLAVFFALSTPLWQPGQDPVLVAGIGVLAGAAMAVTMAGISGLVMERLLAPRRRRGLPLSTPPP